MSFVMGLFTDDLSVYLDIPYHPSLSTSHVDVDSIN